MVLSKIEEIANIIRSRRAAAANNDLSIKETPAGNRVDHISALPDHLLHHILSFLPTRDAIKTSVLSRRWRYMWRPTPALYLDHDDHDGGRCRCFSVLNFAHQWLRERDLIASLHSFHLSFFWANVEVSDVAAVLNHAAGWPLHELYLHFPNMVRFTLPSFIFSLKSLGVLPSLRALGSLRVLTLRNISLDRWPPSTLLPSLEILDLSRVEFASDIARDFVTRSCPRLKRCRIMHMLHGAPELDIDCPLLEVLELEYLDVVWLRIAGERLKTLRIHKLLSNQALLISTPNLETFWWSNKPPHHVSIQRPMSSLSSANIKMESDHPIIGFTSEDFAGAAALVLAVLDSTCQRLEMHELVLKVHFR